VLTGHAPAHQPGTVKGARPEDSVDAPPSNATVTTVLKRADAHDKRLADLAEAVGCLLQQPPQLAPATASTSAAMPYEPPQQQQLASSQPRYQATAPPYTPPQSALRALQG